MDIKSPAFEADIVTTHGHDDHNNVSALRGEPYVITTAGEYDIKDVRIEGVRSHHDGQGGKERGENIIYRIDMDGVIIAHLGDLGAVLDEKQQGALANTDILLIPVGGKFTIDAKQAVEVVSQLEPRIVVTALKSQVSNSIWMSVEKFIKGSGLSRARKKS
jgi:L-ascorbate metabolism protein UlaG (beta-lactamase superfamily)